MTEKPTIIDTDYESNSYLAMAARSGRILAEMSTEGSELIGHVTIGIYSDGTYSCGFKMPDDQPFMGPTLFCAFIKEVPPLNLARIERGKWQWWWDAVLLLVWT
ncbi:hypothetical protein U5A82_18340 [Sphingobium sp. CR2-8]|uniref:hypothetical protein n=1 Tax=Sphingobium sp. CR2-8 TaxID=1306534 RepID=UPI002DB72940|nr:hypothetical protein [Sphingobium sp. CR2-8]MEC3912361.1 hypothetical protein [Sphingobium sp. CR2-8]